MNKKLNIYIMILVVPLIMSVISQCHAKNMLPKDKAIWMAKNHVMDFSTGIQMRAEDLMKEMVSRGKGSVLPIGWDAVQVSKSIYLVRFQLVDQGQKSSYLFHVVLKDKIVVFIHIEIEKEFEAYFENLKATSTYSDKKVTDIIIKFFSS